MEELMDEIEPYDVGIIIGRFQLDQLHSAHKSLIETVCSRHDKVIVLLGLSELKGTANNPLDFEQRKQMLLEDFPELIVLYVKDVHLDHFWSRRVDEIVGDILSPTQSAVLYGSRDSFIKHYDGHYPTRELKQRVFVSGSEMRKKITRKVRNSPLFRAGVIWGLGNRHPTAYSTVDMAIFSEDGTELLMVQKEHENRLRFLGGFASPEDDSHEQTGIREAKEEANVVVDNLQYVTSIKIDDWRYRGEVDKIITTLYRATHTAGDIQPGDDVAYASRYLFTELTEDQIQEEHRPLFRKLQAFEEANNKQKSSVPDSAGHTKTTRKK
jgi:bifunctional NMN adenylyltransferase/nudix hydrolase